MKTAEALAQWVIDNRYPKSENDKVSDFEMYHKIVEFASQSKEESPRCDWIVEIMNRGVLLPSDSLYQYALNNFVEVNNGIYKWKQTYQQSVKSSE